MRMRARFSACFVRRKATQTGSSAYLDFPEVRGTKELKEDSFKKTFLLPALRCEAVRCEFLKRNLQPLVLRLRGIPCVKDDPHEKVSVRIL